MRKQTRIQRLQDACADVGMVFDTWSPGDGVTRYRFFKAQSGTAVNYFAGTKAQPYGCYTALGWKEAVTYVRGAGAFVE